PNDLGCMGLGGKRMLACPYFYCHGFRANVMLSYSEASRPQNTEATSEYPRVPIPRGHTRARVLPMPAALLTASSPSPCHPSLRSSRTVPLSPATESAHTPTLHQSLGPPHPPSRPASHSARPST